MIRFGYYILVGNKGICVGVNFEDIRWREYKVGQGEFIGMGVFFYGLGFSVLGFRVGLNILLGWFFEIWL